MTTPVYLAFNGRRLAMLDTTAGGARHRSAGLQSPDASAGRAVCPQRAAPRAPACTATTMAVRATARIRGCASRRPPTASTSLRIRDVRGLHGDDYAYRADGARAAPDFRLSVASAQSQRAGRRTNSRHRDRAAPGRFRWSDRCGARRPARGAARHRGSIGAGQVSTTLLLSADDHAKAGRRRPAEGCGAGA